MIRLCKESVIGTGGSRGFEGPEYAVFLVRTPAGTIRGYHNRCPHQGLELDWQPHRFLDATGSHIICANHGAVFDVENGHCLQGPCAGQSLEPARLQLRDGYVWLETD